MQKTEIVKNASRATLQRILTQDRALRLKAANEAADMARALCPVSDNNTPGHVHTRDTIRVETEANGDVKVLADGAALWIELGREAAPASPFLLPACEIAGQEVIARGAKENLNIEG